MCYLSSLLFDITASTCGWLTEYAFLQCLRLKRFLSNLQHFAPLYVCDPHKSQGRLGAIAKERKTPTVVFPPAHRVTKSKYSLVHSTNCVVRFPVGWEVNASSQLPSGRPLRFSTADSASVFQNHGQRLGDSAPRTAHAAALQYIINAFVVHWERKASTLHRMNVACHVISDEFTKRSISTFYLQGNRSAPCRRTNKVHWLTAADAKPILRHGLGR